MAFIRCPYCQKIMPGDSLSDPTARWGSPYRKCPQCGKDCVDITRIEPALGELKLPDLSLKHLITVNFFPYGALALICMIGGVFYQPQWFYFAFSLFMIGVYVYRVWEVRRNGDALYEKMKRLYAESEERLKDPLYIRALESLNYAIPQRLLDYAAQFPEAQIPEEGIDDILPG